MEKLETVTQQGNLPAAPYDIKQDRCWTETSSAMLWAAPAFTGILYSMMIDSEGKTLRWTRAVATAATDDKFLYANPDWFIKLALDERVFVGCHEIMHAMWHHCGISHMLRKRGKVTYPDGTVLPFDWGVMGRAMDYIINAVLVESKIGKMPKLGLYDPKLITGEDNVFDAYRKVYKKEKETGQGNKPCPDGDPKTSTKPGDDHGGFDQHLEPGSGEGKDADQAEADRDEGEWRAAITAAANAARLQGKMPAALDRFIKQLLEPQHNWADHIRTVLARKLGSTNYSWNTLDPQMVIRGVGAPGRMGHGADRVVVAIDTSGSVSQQMMDIFLSEVGGVIADLRPKQLILMQCDAHVHSSEELHYGEDLLKVKMKGGGGTSFIPVFDKIASDYGDVDALLYLTDLEGSFPTKAPSYLTIWGATSSHTPPFGEVSEFQLPSDEHSTTSGSVGTG